MMNDREELLRRADGVGILPMLRNMMTEVFRILADPDSSFKHLYDVVKYDQAISSKIISIANSAYYNRGTPVTSLERGMVMIGFKEVERIIMCLVFMKQIISPWKLAQEDMAAIWGHSLLVAHAAKTLSAEMHTEESKKAFAISIVHDIGKVVFYAHDDRYRSLSDEARRDKHDVCDLERTEYGIDHQEVGHRLSVRWEFPSEFSEAILNHHSPLDGGAPVLDVLRAADAFAYGRENILPERERTLLQNGKQAIKAETERIRQLVGV
jgi:HD-like signal output (HDOD) protein